MLETSDSFPQDDFFEFLNIFEHSRQILSKNKSTNWFNQSTKNNTRLYKPTKRGRRAGHKVQQRKLKYYEYKNRGINSCNLTYPTIEKRTKSKACLPSIFYTNCQSLNDTKLTELSNTADNYHPDIICLTETWLNDSKQQASSIHGYTAHFCHRKGRIGGGVAIFTSETLTTLKVAEFTSKTLSALWILITTTSTYPLIIGVIYHPPKACEESTLDYLETTINKLGNKYPNSKLILTGDFNRLPIDNLESMYQLRNLIDFNTRNDARLDLILTDILEYDKALKLAPLSSSDHCGILLKGTSIPSTRYTYIWKRSYNYSVKQDILHNLACVDWSPLLDSHDVDQQVEFLHGTINSHQS